MKSLLIVQKYDHSTEKHANVYINKWGLDTLGAAENQLGGALYKGEPDKLNQIIILMTLSIY